MTDQIRPAQFEPNLPITLAETQIIDIDGQSEDISVSVVFQLHPSPRVVIESDRFSDLIRGEQRKNIKLSNDAQLDVLLGALYFDPEKAILIPACQPVTVIDKNSSLREVSFAILSFPSFYGEHDKWIDDGEQCSRIPHARLETADWMIDITGVPNISEAVKTLQRTRGHGITYTGVVTHPKGTTFSVRNVEQLLEALRFYLSLARGAACSLALVRGRDEMGREAWVRWGAHHSEPGMDYHSAFQRVHSNILSDLFPEFWNLLTGKEDRRDATLRAFDWYLQSNVSAPYIGTILTLAALEAFSFLLLKDGKENNTKKRIERVLSNMQVPLELPRSCESLRSLRNWTTGPQALVAIRNHLVHPQRDLGDVSNVDYWEAWELGQRYFELMLLGRLNYQGCYRNRLATMKGNEEFIVSVPWVVR